MSSIDTIVSDSLSAANRAPKTEDDEDLYKLEGVIAPNTCKDCLSLLELGPMTLGEWIDNYGISKLYSVHPKCIHYLVSVREGTETEVDEPTKSDVNTSSYEELLGIVKSQLAQANVVNLAKADGITDKNFLRRLELTAELQIWENIYTKIRATEDQELINKINSVMRSLKSQIALIKIDFKVLINLIKPV